MTTRTFIDDAGASGADRHVPSAFWWRRAGYGMLLGASIALLEFAYYAPLVAAGGKVGVESLASLLVVWSGEGVLLALTLGFVEIREAPRTVGGGKLALAVVIVSTAGVMGWQAFVHLILREHFGFRVLRDYVSQPVDLMGVALYHVWLMLLFGGLAAGVYFSWQRNARMLAALRAVELSREDTRRRLAETRLDALQERIDPEFLLQRLKELEHLYDADPAAAARLLEDFIIFLRGALSEVRAAESTAPLDRKVAGVNAFAMNQASSGVHQPHPLSKEGI